MEDEWDSYYVDRRLVLNYYDSNIGEYVEYSSIIGKEFTTNFYEMLVYKNENDIARHVYADEPKLEDDERLVAILKEGESFKVLALNENHNSALIEFRDGQSGWIGGFHQYWD